MSTRPRERHGTTQRFSIGDTGLKGYLTINVDSEGRPMEVFLSSSKQGSLVSGMTHALALLISHSLQRNPDSLQDIVDALGGVTFEPNGSTGDEEVPHCTSLPDYVASKLARYLS